MRWQIMHPHMTPQVFRAPVRQRVHFDAAVRRILDQRQRAAGATLETFTAGYPGLETARSFVQRLDLALPAAQIGIGLSHPVREIGPRLDGSHVS